MKKITSESFIAYMDSENKEALKAKSGETVIFETKDCFSNLIKNTKEDLLELIEGDLINPATGPLYIEDAEIGDILAVEILDIKVSDSGIYASLPGYGIEDKYIKAAKAEKVKVENGKVYLNDKITLDLDPMVGVIGVAAKGEKVKNDSPGDHGGNLDCKMIKKGATVYLPVFTKGALLSIGDLHAHMGDGEVSGSGVEIKGEVTVKLSIIKGKSYPLPMLKNEDRLMTISTKDSLDEAARDATDMMMNVLVDNLGADPHKAAGLLSVAADLRICQVVNPKKTVRMELDLDIAKKYGFDL